MLHLRRSSLTREVQSRNSRIHPQSIRNRRRYSSANATPCVRPARKCWRRNVARRHPLTAEVDDPERRVHTQRSRDRRSATRPNVVPCTRSKRFFD
jgi:hypothetical protein